MLVKFKHFNALTPHELYALLALRSEVFVVEQACIYQDLDGLDGHGFHALMSEDNGVLIGTARILPPDSVYSTPAIGRFVIAHAERGHGYAHDLLRACIREVEQLYSTTSITISAQLYLENFYGRHNFVRTGSEYLEDGIPHIKMKRL